MSAFLSYHSMSICSFTFVVAKAVKHMLKTVAGCASYFFNDTKKENKKGSVYSYNNFQQIVVRIAVNLILTTNNITDLTYV
jgi:hypothetical protein